ncbi:gluconate 5-dehydrogenase [Actinomadura meyerae]|uniref:Gluconate 5-dehydrogenase n=1 Tax=Actinomadura meyerae TaxID=240840 RepID=A0A239P594_9ACTN|nr:SDR family oxidoreductase [Actinomadura meyerae]SNT62132.1 gluconate 5-dehydrogenase [Actinomadura meyerae]
MTANERQPLAGRIAVVTGAGRGIGESTARVLAAAGAHVVLTARSAAELDRVLEQIARSGGSAESRAGDLTAPGFVDELFDGVRRRHGRLDVLVNNAGTAAFGPIEDVPPEQVRAVLDINTVAPYACMRRAIVLMRERGTAGHVVNIGSVEAHWTAQGESGAYPASKFALRALTLAVSKQLGLESSPIRVSLVNPGGSDTMLVNPDRAPRTDLLDPDAVACSVLHIVTAPPGSHVFELGVVATGRHYW